MKNEEQIYKHHKQRARLDLISPPSGARSRALPSRLERGGTTRALAASITTNNLFFPDLEFLSVVETSAFRPFNYEDAMDFLNPMPSPVCLVSSSRRDCSKGEGRGGLNFKQTDKARKSRVERGQVSLPNFSIPKEC